MTLLRGVAWVALTGMVACRGTSDAPMDHQAPPASAPPAPVDAPGITAPPSASPSAKAPAPPMALDASRYGWLGNSSRPFPKPDGTLLSRFPAPSGYTRVPLDPASFGFWLRHFPVAAPNTPVVSHEGEPILPGDDEYVAAVLAIDVGTKNLQHGADVALRLHAEWLWATAEHESVSYRANAKLDMPFERYARGERVSARAGAASWMPLGKPADEPSHEDFRDYLDSVFNWVNSRSVLAQAAAPPHADARPGDFVAHEGSPAEAVVILDMARDATKKRTLVLLGRALSPAQSIQVLGIGAKIPWFEISPPTPLLTPRTDEFPWTGLRRLDGPAGAGGPASAP